MPRLLPLAVALFLLPTRVPLVAAAPTPAQLCESAMELASAKYAQCRLVAQSKDAKAPNAAKLTEALGRCSQKLSDAFAKATLRYGAACAATEPSSAFDEYLKQCSDDTVAAAGGAALPNYLADLASCNGDLSTCDGDLATCASDLATTSADLTTCDGNLAACEALPPAQLLKTGQTTNYGLGTDGDLQLGIAQGYVDNGDGTITDTRTGLMWEKKSDDGSVHDRDDYYTWSTGSPYLNDGTAFSTFLPALNTPPCFAGHCDWRLPNINELESIRNLNFVNPAVSAEFYNSGCPSGCTVLTCSCTSTSLYWSSSTFTRFSSDAWGVSFADGAVVNGLKVTGAYVRAVRGL